MFQLNYLHKVRRLDPTAIAQRISSRSILAPPRFAKIVIFKIKIFRIAFLTTF